MNLNAKVTALNSILSDIYETEDARVSQLLARAGFDARDIQTLRSRHMAKLADKLREIVKKQVFKDHQLLFQLLSFRHGLEEERPLSLRNTGARMRLSGERVRQLEEKALSHCRKNERIQILESALKEYAGGLLASQGKESPRQTPEDTVHSNNNSASSQKSVKACEFEIRSDENSAGSIILKPLNRKGRPEIVVTESNAQWFRDAFDHAAKSLGWKFASNNANISEIKKKYARAYEKWEREEDRKLAKAVADGLVIDEISTILERQPSAVKSRIEKLGLGDRQNAQS